MPCRTRLLGPEAEGLGIVSLEAAAAGLPVLKPLQCCAALRIGPE